MFNITSFIFICFHFIFLCGCRDFSIFFALKAYAYYKSFMYLSFVKKQFCSCRELLYCVAFLGSQNCPFFCLITYPTYNDWQLEHIPGLIMQNTGHTLDQGQQRETNNHKFSHPLLLPIWTVTGKWSNQRKNMQVQAQNHHCDTQSWNNFT